MVMTTTFRRRARRKRRLWKPRTAADGGQKVRETGEERGKSWVGNIISAKDAPIPRAIRGSSSLRDLCVFKVLKR